MSDLKGEIEQIQALTQTTEKLQTVLTESSSEAGERLRALRNRIMNGESTGNRWLDYVICRHHSLAEEIVRAYEELDERLATANGQFVLVISRDERPTRHIFGQGGKDYQPCEFLSLVILDGTELIIEKGGFPHCVLPARRSILPNGTSSDLPIDVSQYGTRSQTPFPRRLMFLKNDPRPSMEMEIVVGDEAVHAWFQQRAKDCIFPGDGEKSILNFAKMAKGLGRPLDEQMYPVVAETNKKKREQIRNDFVVTLGMLLAKKGYGGRFKHITDPAGSGQFEKHLQILYEEADIWNLLEEGLMVELTELCRQHKIVLSQ